MVEVIVCNVWPPYDRRNEYKVMSEEEIIDRMLKNKIDCENGFREKKKRNEKSMSLCEVVKNDIRKIYLNINRWKNRMNENGELDNIMNIFYDFQSFLSNKIDKISGAEPPKFIMSINPWSHREWDRTEGSHIICYNYCMDYRDMEKLINEFIVVYPRWRKYIDISKEKGYLYHKYEFIRFCYECGYDNIDIPIDENDRRLLCEDCHSIVIPDDIDRDVCKNSIISNIDECIKLDNRNIDINDAALVVDCRGFWDNYDDNYKYLYIDDIVEDMVSRSENIDKDYSRYEVLDIKNRKIYLDIDGSDECIDIEGILFNFSEYLYHKLRKYGRYDIPRFVVTENKYSGHSVDESNPVSSYHIICYNYSMDYWTMYCLVSEFLSSDCGHIYNKVIDTCVYSKRRIFKLPYYIGLHKDKDIDKSNNNNYHRLLYCYEGGIVRNMSKVEMLKKCFIQNTTNTYNISYIRVNKNFKKKNYISCK